MTKPYKFLTLSIHAGQHPDTATGSVTTPIYQTSTFAQKSPGVFVDRFDYARTANPTRSALEANLAALEDGAHGICFGSGSAATSAVLTLLSSGDHILASDDVYGGTFQLFDKVFKRFGITYSLVDMTDMGALEAAVTPQTKMLWLETPSNPTLKIIDISAVAGVGKKKKLLTVVDNTFASPYLQRPLSFGADNVTHSTTKYLGGHSDLIGGAVIVNDPDLAKRLLSIQNDIGSIPSPMDCYLLLRSTKTLALRMRQHCENARQIADSLDAHPNVVHVYYPGLKNHPNHDVAKRQMVDFGAMISFTVKGGEKEAKTFLEKLTLFAIAKSLGGVESLIEHAGSMSHASIPKAHREAIGITDNFIRMSVGIEDPEDLIEDLKAALT